MGLFGKKKDKELEAIVNQIRVDLSNNYKDNAVENIKKLESTLKTKKESGKLKDAEEYEKLLEHFQEDVKSASEEWVPPRETCRKLFLRGRVFLRE